MKNKSSQKGEVFCKWIPRKRNPIVPDEGGVLFEVGQFMFEIKGMPGTKMFIPAWINKDIRDSPIIFPLVQKAYEAQFLASVSQSDVISEEE